MGTEIRVLMPAPGIGLVSLDGPEHRNALDGNAARALVAAIRELDADPEIGALVVGGTEDAFCAGANRSVLAAVAGGSDQAGEDLLAIYEIFSTLRAATVPTVAAVCGPAVGAGLNLALACDVRILGTNAVLRSMFMANSIQPAGGHLRMLQELGGDGLAIRLAVFDQPLGAEAALAAGIAAIACEPPRAEEEAVRFAGLAAARPDLARSIKRSVATVSGLDLEQAAEREGEAQATTLREERR